MVCLPVKNILICTWAAILAAKKRGNKEKEKLFCKAKKDAQGLFLMCMLQYVGTAYIAYCAYMQQHFYGYYFLLQKLYCFN